MEENNYDRLFAASMNYITSDEVLLYIRRKCDFYTNSEDRMFDFSISIKIHDLLDSDSELGNLVLNDPLRACEIFHKAVFTLIQSEALLPKCLQSTTVSVSLRLQSLPSLPCYQMKTSSDLRKFSKFASLAQFQGIIAGMSMTEKYTKSARFVCPSAICDGSFGNKFIRCHIPGSPEHQTVRDDFLCSYCGQLLIEDVSKRILGEKCVIEVIDKDAFDNNRRKFKYQSIPAVLRDDLIKMVHIGLEVTIIGLPVFYPDQQIFVLEANNVQLIEDAYENQNFLLTKQLGFQLHGPLQILYEDRKGSPWSFGLSIAFGFGGSVVPPGTYLNLKLGMLLSLLSSQEQPPGISILAIGSDDLQVKRLFSYGAQFASRYVIHSTASHLSAFATRDRLSSRIFLEGGSLLLAGDGVCVLPDLGCSKKAMKETVLQVLETGSFQIGLQPLPSMLLAASEQPSSLISLQCQCKIWSCLDFSSAKYQNCIENSACVTPGQVNDMNKLFINLFSLVFTVDAGPGSIAERLTSDDILTKAMGGQSKPLFQDNNLRELLYYASKLDVTIDTEAQRLIRGYYLASRRVRNSDSAMGLMPRTAILTISSLTEAHARLNLRVEAGEYDAVMAILLFEEVLLSKTGVSVLNVKPLVHANHEDISRIIGPERDMQLLNFYQQFKRFLVNHAPDLDSCLEE